MAKKAILDVLESTIGRYVCNLDAESLNVAVWSGKIELHSLQLDTTAVNNELARRAHEAPNLACPFQVIEGRFEKVQLDVPWARLTSRPVVFHARGLWVHVEPHDFLRVGACQTKSQPNVVEERANDVAVAEAARKRVNAVRMTLEEDGKAEAESAGKEDVMVGEARQASPTLTKRLVRRIVENLQFEIEDVHVAVRGCGCAAGLVLGSLSLVTTDANGNRTFVDRQTNSKDPMSSFLNKELLISGFGIYLQRDSENHDSVKRRMIRLSKQTQYILSPLSFQAKLRQSDLDKCVDFPKYLVQSKLSALSIGLSRTQLELGHRLALAVAPNHDIRPLFPEYRPLVPISGHTKQWWLYILRCIGRLNRYRSWVEFYSAFQKRKKYQELYKRHIYSDEAPWLIKLKSSELAELEAIENDRSISIEGLMHWRTISDAQIEKEREKHDMQKQVEETKFGVKGNSSITKKSRYALFSSTPRKESKKDSIESDLTEKVESENIAPIILSHDEMKELEELAMKMADQILTKDSKLCDVNFTLGSFQVNLSTALNQPITSMKMDMVSTSFNANADGSFGFHLSLLSLELSDSTTLGTYYPTICRSLQDTQSKQSHAFQLQLSKSKDGDQELVLKMVACEIVASPLLLFAVRDFFKLPVPVASMQSESGLKIGVPNNPMLLQSISGDDDLFFDAREGASSVMVTPSSIPTPTTTASIMHHTIAQKEGKVSDKISSAVLDAWNGKNRNKQKWNLDFDISAPILILPENCVHPDATALICNFGKFNFTYGTDALSRSVVEWFDARQRANKMDSQIDHLKLEMNDLSFTISSVGNASKDDVTIQDLSSSVISPISFTLDIGLEHTISSGDSTPRTCVIGVLPAIILRLAPSDVTKVLRVAGIWSSNLHKLRGDVPIVSKTSSSLLYIEEEQSEIDLISSGSSTFLDAEISEGGKSTSLSKKVLSKEMTHERESNKDKVPVEFMNVSLSLLRLSINIYTESGDGVETHLVSVKASSSLSTDGSSSTRLCMGWFWILDCLESELRLPRRQRLVCHSNLPRSAETYAMNDQYSMIMDDLTEQGVFSSNYSGSADLADILIRKLSLPKGSDCKDLETEFSPEYLRYTRKVEEVTMIHAKFTSLFINWNPNAIKSLFVAKDNLIDFKHKAYSTYENISFTKNEDQARDDLIDYNPVKAAEETSMFIFARMDTFEISLNSAKDDLPLFTLTMCDSKVNRHQLNEDNAEMNVVVGDLRIVTPTFGRALLTYRTLLGLAPSVSTSLISVKYSKGVHSVSSCNVAGADKSKCEACAVITLSPIRFVHLHAQIFTLIDYISDGIFGAMAGSTAAAALEVAKSSQNGERLFYVVASGFDFILPRSAYSENYFVFHAGVLQAHYRSLNNDKGSISQVTLNDVSMQCDQKMQMLSTPVNLFVAVSIKPPLAPGTEEERATRVDMTTSRIRILLARCHYAQIMYTLDSNIGETNNFLRIDSIGCNWSTLSKDEKGSSSELGIDSFLKQLNHAGVRQIEVIKRLYINFKIQELSLELCGEDADDPIISLSAVNAQVLIRLLPDEKQTKAYVTLHDLVCDDMRLGSHDRTFRQMIGRASAERKSSSEVTASADNEDVFQLNYTKHSKDESRIIEVKIGSSQIVVLPDVITDMMNFIKISNLGSGSKTLRASSDLSNAADNSMQVVIRDENPEGVEACYGSLGEGGFVALKKTNYIVESSNMILVLVDMGSMDASGSFVTSKHLTETIVLQGKMQAQFELTTDNLATTTIGKEYRIDAERVEIYTAHGASLIHPVQILEPAKFSIFYYQDIGLRSGTHVTDLKFVTLTPIDVTISMQNAALASALASSISDSFDTNGDRSEDEVTLYPLSATDAVRIARLDSALGQDSDQSIQSVITLDSNLSVHRGKALLKKRRVIKVKMTLPETTLTVTNDFQGLDEALFKIIAMNCVFGGEIDYPSDAPSEMPCFGFNTNTSVLAEYFDVASGRWETLLTHPWEITFNGSRGPHQHFDTPRMSSTFDIESNPCHISFSEHFLVNVGAASRMWSVYSGATTKATALVEGEAKTDKVKRRLSRSMAAHAARSLITTLPYAIENHSGINAHYSILFDPNRLPLPSSSTRFFQFELFPGRGTGGLRKYGQDITHLKSLTIYIGSSEFSIHDMDREVNKSRSAHYITDYQTHIFTKVVKRGNSTILHLSSHVEVYNSTSLPFRIGIIGDDFVHDLGVIHTTRERKSDVSNRHERSLLQENEELLTHSVFGLPAHLLRSFTVDSSETLCVQLSPVLKGLEPGLSGLFNLPHLDQLVEISTSDDKKFMIEVTCYPISRKKNQPSLTANVCCKVSLVDDTYPFVQLQIQPRIYLTNKLPIDIVLRTPMPHTHTTAHTLDNQVRDIDPDYTVHELKPLGSVEVFTPGPSIAISMRCADLPIAGATTEWMDDGWLDIPLGVGKKLPEPVKCIFPFQNASLVKYSSSRHLVGSRRGSEFFVLEEDDVTPELRKISERNVMTKVNSMRILVIVVCNYAVDHTGNLLFEEVDKTDEDANLRISRMSKSDSITKSPPFSAFSSAKHRRRVTLLPSSSRYIRLVELTMDGDEGMKRSTPFKVEDVSIATGIDAMSILWANTTPSGYYAYRHLTAEGSEIHVVPEFVIFNGSHHPIMVKQLGRTPFLLEISKISPISRDRNNSILVQFEVPSINGLTGPVQIDQVGLRILLAKSKKTGEALGSLAVQTITGAKDSRLVIKIGALNFNETQPLNRSGGLFEHDFMRFRVRWSEMKVTLKDTQDRHQKYEENRTAIRKYLERHNVNSVEVEKKLAQVRKEYNSSVEEHLTSFPDVAQILLHRFTVDFQRIFKESEHKNKGIGVLSNERSQVSVVIHNVSIIDCSPNTKSPNVFDSMSDKSFFDLCVRTRGPMNADLIRVDLFDLNLAYGNGKAEKIIIDTGEDFVWRLLDIANRTVLATAELAGVDLDLKWNEETGKFSVNISDPRLKHADDLDSDGNYQPPRSDKLFDVKKLRVSPFVLLFSFKRQPQSSRYAFIQGVRGAKLTNYFTSHLKFTIDRAELPFQGYMARDIKGPTDRLVDTLKTVYITQLKTKMVTLMTATSFQDWKYLTARESGGEEFIEGDLLRMTGNLAGRSAKFVLKKSGDYIGDGLMAVTETIGGGIQEVSETIGVGAVGAGVNSFVSGLGEGVGSTVKGVGTGAGDIVRGAGKGIGQVIGGIGGGAQIVAKGLGKGITTGDMSGVGEGFASMGNGIGQGVETAMEGTVNGVLSMSRGVFSGVKSLGKGIGGAFMGGQDMHNKAMPPRR